MNRYRIYAALIAVVIVSGCAAKTVYEIIERKEEMNGLVVSYRVGVPDNHSNEDLQGWCNEITGSEGSGKVVNIEFVFANRLTQQRGLCTSGKLLTIGDLRRQFGDMPAITPPPGMAPIPRSTP